MRKWGTWKIRSEEKLVYGIFRLLNAMTELSRLAEKYGLESKLYQEQGGLGKVQELMGEERYKKFLRRICGLSLSDQDK